MIGRSWRPIGRRLPLQARDALREAEVMGCAPDAYTEKMAERLAEATRALVMGC
jgi:hypothetical protein